MSQTEVSPIARTTTYFLPVNISSVTSPNSSEVEVAVNTSWEPVTSPPASSAMTIPAHTSQGQQPISLHAAVSSNREQTRYGRGDVPVDVKTSLCNHSVIQRSASQRPKGVCHFAAEDTLGWVTCQAGERGRFGGYSRFRAIRTPLHG